MHQLVKSIVDRPRKAAFWFGSAVAAASFLALPAVASAASPELTDACNRFVASSPMSALPQDCKGVVSPVVFPSAGSSSGSNSSVSSIVSDNGAEAPEAPQVVANADATFLASVAGQDLLAQARAMAGGSRHIVVVMTPQLASQIAAGTIVNVRTTAGSFALGQYCQMADGSLANVLAVSAGNGALLLMVDTAGNVTAVDCLLPAGSSHTQTTSSTYTTPVVTTTVTISPVTTGPVSAPGTMVY